MPAVLDYVNLTPLGEPQTTFVSLEEYTREPGRWDLADPEQRINIETGIDTASVAAAELDPLTQAGTTLATEAGIATEAGREAQVGGLAGQVGAGLEGAADALTLGGYSAARVAIGGEETREELEDRAKLYAGTRAAGQFAGDIASLGLGTAKGSLALVGKLSPGARAARTATRIGESGGVARRLAGGAYDAALQGAGTAIAEEAMANRPWSAEAVASRAITAGLLGAGATGVVSLAGAGLSRAARALDDRAARSLAEEAAGDASAALARQADDVMGSPTKQVSWRSLFTRSEVDRNAVTREARKTVAKIAESSERVPAARQVLDAADVTLGDAATTAPARVALEEFEAAAEAARKWAEPLGTKTKGKAKRSLARRLGEDPDQAITVLSRFDEATIKLEDAVTAVRQRVDPTTLAKEVDTTATGLKGLVARGRESLKGRRGEQIADVVAGAELAGDVTGFKPTSLLSGVPLIGSAVSAYLKFRAIKSAFSKRGFLPGSKATRAAQQGADTANRIQSAVSTVAKAGARGLAGRPGRAIAKMTTAAITTATNQIREPEILAERAADAVIGLPDEVAKEITATLDRADAYLSEHRPVLPPDSPFAGEALINPAEIQSYEYRRLAVYEPDAAIEQVMSLGHPRPHLAVESILAVYPAMYAQVQAELLAQVEQIAKRPEAIRSQIGTYWSVPLSRAQLPTRPPASPPPVVEPEPMMPAAPAPGQDVAIPQTISALQTPQDQRGHR